MSTCDRCEAVWRRLCCNVVQYDLFRRILRHHASAVVPGFLLEDSNIPHVQDFARSCWRKNEWILLSSPYWYRDPA